MSNEKLRFLVFMKLRMKKAVIASAIIFSMNISSANDSFYLVKKGDTISSILYAENIKPIYGKHGALVLTLKLNPQIRQSRGKKIFPNMKIILAHTEPPHIVIAAKNEQKKSPPTNQEAYLGEVVIANAVKVMPQEQALIDRTPSDNFKQSFYWEATPSLSWKNLSSTDDNIYRTSKIKALSNMNYGLGLTYGMHFEEDIDVYSKLALESVSFIEDSSIHLEKKNFLFSRFNVGILYEQKWLLEVGMNDEFFLTSPATSRVEIKKVTLPEIKSGYQKDFYQNLSAKLSYLLSGIAVLPRSIPGVESRLGYGFGAGIEAKLKNQSFIIGYDLKLLKASSNSTGNHNIYWNYVWKTL